MFVRAFTLWIILFTLPSVVQAAPVSGKVALDGVGTTGVQVAAYPADAVSLTASPQARSAATGADGLFTVDLPPGQYYLLAHGAGWFSYYGRNPVTVPPEGLDDVNLPLVPDESSLPAITPAIDNGIAGLVLQAGKPVANAVVFAYPDLSAQLKGFGLGMSVPTGADGLFELPLPSGSYYLVARVRHGSSLVGPLTAGDLFGYLPQNPVLVGSGVGKVSLPVVAVPEKIARHSDTMFGQTRISGTVVDRDGKPLTGMKALLYADESMLNRPLYVSAPTGPDGAFHLSFPTGGSYYLAARNTLGGTPAPGELYGRYYGDGQATLKVETGNSVVGIRIVAEEVW